MGRGATFRLTLPLPEDQRVTLDEPNRPSPTPTHLGAILTGVRVVVVEDEPDSRELVTTILTRAGAIVHVAASAAEGVNLLENCEAQVLVSDLGMPDEDGYALIQRVRRHENPAIREIPALALTALASEEDRSKAVRAGFTSHLGKPVAPRELVDEVINLALSGSGQHTH
ncbi:MAG: response regulator [Polyangiaceae bacterium]